VISLRRYRSRERAPCSSVPQLERIERGVYGDGEEERETRKPSRQNRARRYQVFLRGRSGRHLRLSLVSCPVALYKATSRTNDISFNLLNPETNNRVRMIPTDPETAPVNRSDLVRGYETEKNRYVIIDDEALDAVKLETTHTLGIERFVDADSIDRFLGCPLYSFAH
jgi:hypothetical protein